MSVVLLLPGLREEDANVCSEGRQGEVSRRQRITNPRLRGTNMNIVLKSLDNWRSRSDILNLRNLAIYFWPKIFHDCHVLSMFVLLFGILPSQVLHVWSQVPSSPRPFYWAGSGDFVLASRQLILSVRGYPEARYHQSPKRVDAMAFTCWIIDLNTKNGHFWILFTCQTDFWHPSESEKHGQKHCLWLDTPRKKQCLIMYNWFKSWWTFSWVLWAFETSASSASRKHRTHSDGSWV